MIIILIPFGVVFSFIAYVIFNMIFTMLFIDPYINRSWTTIEQRFQYIMYGMGIHNDNWNYAYDLIHYGEDSHGNVKRAISRSVNREFFCCFYALYKVRKGFNRVMTEFPERNTNDN